MGIMLAKCRSIGVGKSTRSTFRQRGAALILATIAMGVLLAMGGLAVDAGRLFVTKTELQSAMDACALAAAAQINPGSPNPLYLQAAQAHGRAMIDPSLSSTSGGGARPITSINRAYFQGNNLTPGSVAVEFSPNLTGPFSTIAGGAVPTTTNYVRCSYSMAGIPLTLIRALAAAPVPNGGTPITIPSTTTVTSFAVAARTGSPGDPATPGTCGVVPMAVCMVPGSSAATNWGYARGQWIAAPCASGDPACPNPGPGNFGWADLTPPSGGASELTDALGGAGACGGVAIGTSIGETGIVASVHKAWNSRFGVYGPGGGLNQTNAPPDYTGFSYKTSVVNPGRYDADYSTHRASSDAFNRAGAGFLPANFGGTMALTSQQYAIYGRSRRLVTAPVVNCALLVGGATAPVQGLACLFLLSPYPIGGPGAFVQRVEYLGIAGAPLPGQLASPCMLSGVPGGGGGGSITASVPFLVR